MSVLVPHTPALPLAAGVARDALETLLAELLALSPSRRRDEQLGAVEQAIAALGPLAGESTGGLSSLAALERATDAVERVGRELGKTRERLPRRCRERVALLEAMLERCRGQAIDAVVAAQGHAAERQATTAEPFRASLGLPHLFDVQLLGGEAYVAARRRLPDAAEDAERDADRASMARSCLEEIGRLGELRRATDDKPWSQAYGGFDQRLLDNLDAFLALGQSLVAEGNADPPLDGGFALRQVQRFTGQALNDPRRVFVRSFVLACLRDDDAPRAAVVALRQVHPRTHDAAVDGLALSPHPGVQAAMEQLCHEADPYLVRIALRVLGARRTARLLPSALLLAHPDPEVRREAAVSLEGVADRGPATAVLADALADERDERVAAAVAQCLVALDDPRGLEHARARLAAERERPGSCSPAGRAAWVRLVCLAGDGSDLEALVASATTPGELLWLGWYGHPMAVPALLAVLEEGADSVAGAADDPRCRAAARALHRITGGLEGALRSHDLVRVPHRAVTSAGKWLDWHDEHASELPATGKLRFGDPYGAGSVIDELLSDLVPFAARATCAWELALLTGGQVRLWTGGWTARQLAALTAGKQLLATDAPLTRLHAPGEWPARRLGRRTAKTERTT